MPVETQIEKGIEPRPVMVQEPDHSVMLYNSTNHTFGLVVLQLEKVLGCGLYEACRYVEVAKLFGSACLFTGPMDACTEIAYELSTIRLDVKVK